MTFYASQAEAETDPLILLAVTRGFIEIKNQRVRYVLANTRTEDWGDPEEWVRCRCVAWLVLERDYPAACIKTEVTVPRRTPSDVADIVVYTDDTCRTPYLVVENKRAALRPGEKAQAIEQLFGNVNSLRAPWGLYDSGDESILFDAANFASMEREANQLGPRERLASQYDRQPVFAHVVGEEGDIQPARKSVIESKIRFAHSRIWSGGKRDPLRAFDEWSKLLFAKVHDERWSENGKPRGFQVGTGETSTAVANRVHRLFEAAKGQDPAIFDDDVQINLPDKKILEVVRALQAVSFVDTDVDNIGAAFEDFFGSVFRGELGQYFTMRQIARFSVAVLDIGKDDYVLDPTAGSGGFLLEVLLQVWHSIDRAHPPARRERLRNDFALSHVYGIEIHDILARICKINLLLHHDGHTNIEADKSCLDSVYSKPRLTPPRGQFTRIVGNPPFGDEVKTGDEDLLGANELASFALAEGRDRVQSEHVIVERCVELLQPGGRMGLVLPDGVFNNAGENSNCPAVRRHLAKTGIIEAVVSLPDYAFRRSGAQNKTSILFFRKFTLQEQSRFTAAYDTARAVGSEEDVAIRAGLVALRYRIFMAEAAAVGYTATGAISSKNDLYVGSAGGMIADSQGGSILGEYRRFQSDPLTYDGTRSPDCMAIDADAAWDAHASHRLDPKYHLFKREEKTVTPAGWLRLPIGRVMRRREELARPETAPEETVVVMTLSQTGEIRPREAGKGRNPPEWLGMYFEDSPSTWYSARSGDVVFSSIDLWKGCISVVPANFDGALVTKEFPIYEVVEERLNADFLWCLLRSRYYQRAFRAITTGHSNRRRTQSQDFEALEIVFPASAEAQEELVAEIFEARTGQQTARENLRAAMLAFSDVIDGRGGEELPDVEDQEEAEEGAG
ncbi:N-6 DNA methylase [Luteimonas sp. MJ204]|uniref:N-6 DNA methylase n=1 Tax=Luteimonas sp. MJ145 TaxID=3129234 RepID=UPI0031B9B55C